MVNNISKAYVAKNIAKYLKIKIPSKHTVKVGIDLPTADEIKTFMNILTGSIDEQLLAIHKKVHHLKTFFYDKKEYSKIKRSMMDEKRMQEQTRYEFKKAQRDLEKKLESKGLITYTEKEAYYIINDAALAMDRSIYQISSDNRTASNKIYITLDYNQLEQLIDTSIGQGIMSLVDRYWIPIKGTKTPKIVNDEFRKDSTAWIMEQTEKALYKSKRCFLLETIELYSQSENKFVMSPYDIDVAD